MVINKAVSSAHRPCRPGLQRSERLKTRVTRRRKRVLLVDRHPLMRCMAAEWINRCSGLKVCGMVHGVTQALRAVARLHPDVVVCEIMRPRNLGFIRELHRRHPRLRILVFSIQDEAVYGARARAAGADRYLGKAAGGTELIRSVRAVLRAGRKAGRNGLPRRLG